jgi:hypothetical protein
MLRGDALLPNAMGLDSKSTNRHSLETCCTVNIHG